MPVITTHNITLYGSAGAHKIVLRPLTDEHLPLLYRWNADPEVLYWVDGRGAKGSAPEDVRGIWRMCSPQAHCFLIEADGVPVGECWLQKMLERQRAVYRCPEPLTLDVRRIDMSIGEKDWWGKGVGAAMIKMLVDFAFAREGTQVLYGITFDYNRRSQRTFEKNGFRFVEEFLADGETEVTHKLRLAKEEWTALPANAALSQQQALRRPAVNSLLEELPHTKRTPQAAALHRADGHRGTAD